MTEFRIVRALILFGLLIVVGWFLYAVRSVLAPFVLGAVLAYALSPLVWTLELRGIRRSSAVLVLFMGLSLMVFVLIYWGIGVFWQQELPRLQVQMPGYLAQIKAAAIRIEGSLADKWPWFREERILERAFQYVVSVGRSGWRVVPGYLSSVLNVSLYVILIPVVSYVFLRGGKSFIQNLLDQMPGRWVERFVSLFYEIDAAMGGYARGRILESAIVGSLAAGGLLVLGVSYASLIGIVAGLTNLVPYLGPLVGGILGVGLAFAQFHTLGIVLKVALLFCIVQLIDNFVLQPLIMKRSVNLHPVLVIFVLLCGGKLAGIWGLLFAVPITCVIKVILQIFMLWYVTEFRIRPLSVDLQEAAAKPWII